jgi:hypothetical protein
LILAEGQTLLTLDLGASRAQVGRQNGLVICQI